MAGPVKVESDELRQATQIRQTFVNLTHEYGKLAFAQRTIDREKEQIEKQFDELLKDEEQFIRELNERYGTGTLNIETGQFTPEKSV